MLFTFRLLHLGGRLLCIFLIVSVFLRFRFLFRGLLILILLFFILCLFLVTLAFKFIFVIVYFAFVKVIKNWVVIGPLQIFTYCIKLLVANFGIKHFSKHRTLLCLHLLMIVDLGYIFCELLLSFSVDLYVELFISNDVVLIKFE